MSRFGACVLFAVIASFCTLNLAASTPEPVLVKFDVVLDKAAGKEGSFTVEALPSQSTKSRQLHLGLRVGCAAHDVLYMQNRDL